MTDIELRMTDPRLQQWGLPAYMTPGAAGLDLRACLDAPLSLAPQAAAILIPAGIALHMANPGMAAVILPRSGLGHKKGLVLGNSVGLIDSDYTATLMISAWNRNPDGAPLYIEPGERIAQLIFVPILRPELRVVDSFSVPTERGGGGFGSTG
ncbi:MAG TPA: dUTP diphosphatase [Acidiferrobacteraceae bacterium]|nr:dUTP diphosphatase [Acidiferrobacteraceae bacterium]